MWIETRKKVPKVSDTVLICTESGHVCSGYLAKRYENLWVLHDNEMSKEIVIAWQPLPTPLTYSNGIPCSSVTTRTSDDFSKDETDLGDAAFIECMDHIKNTVQNYLVKDEILYSVWKAISSGVSNFLDDYHSQIVKQVASEIAEDIQDNMEIQVSIKK